MEERIQINFQVTAAEREKIKANAYEAHLSLSEYLRRLAMKG